MNRFRATAGDRGRSILRMAAGLLLLVCTLAGGAAAQGGPEAGPVPAGDGEIRVEVVRPDGSRAAGVDVVLYALPPEAAPGLARGVTDEQGLAVFPEVATEPAIAYLVGVRDGDVPYGERVGFEEGQRTVSVTVEVALTESDTSALRLGAANVRIDRGCDTLEVTESHAITNPTDRVVYVASDEREGRQPVLVQQLPLQAGPLRSALGPLPQGVVRDGSTLRFWGPVYPGTQELDLSYGLPSSDGDATFRWRFPRGAPDVSWLAPADGAELVAPALTRARDRRLDGVAYTVLRSTDLGPDAEVAVQVRIGDPSTPPIRIEETRVWIELDDAVLEASERHQIVVAGDAPLGPGPAPVLCMSLPAGAADLRFDAATLAMGPSSASSGAVAFRGPIPAGQAAVALSYRIPLAGGAAVFARRLPLDVPLLEMFVSDTGIRPLTDRLHRLRPIRNADRNYLHLQGFGLSAGEELAITFEPLPAPRGLPRLAAMGFGLLAAGATFAFLMGPLRGAGSNVILPASRTDELAAEREAVYAVIRDLDEDFETGKLTADDHATMRSEMRERAVALLRQERSAESTPAPAPTARAAELAAREAKFCIDCGEALPSKARFCPQCGVKTEAGDA